MVDLIKESDNGLDIIYFSSINIKKNSVKNKNNEMVEYINFATILPIELKEFLSADMYVYFYKYNNRIYLTNNCPIDKNIECVRRKLIFNKGSYMITLSKKMFPKLSVDSMKFKYILHTGYKDFINGSYGLIECNVD